MKIELVPISSLVFDPANARKHNQKNIDAIKGSLARFKQQKPIVVNKDNVVIAGNGTLQAAKELGWEKIAIVRTDLDGTDMTAFGLADNRSAELADWDLDNLGGLLKSLQEEDFDLDSIGFDEDDLRKLISEDIPPGNTDDDAVPENVETRCKPGDLWILGNHRLLCGDSTNVQHVERLMNGEKADMVFTDPPYNHASEEKLVSQSVRQAMKKLSESEWDKNFSFLDVAGSIEVLLSENATVYVCTSWHLAGEIWEWMKKRSSHYSYCVWHKPNPMPSLMKRHWTWSTELICYATFGKHTFNFPSEGHASNVWSVNKNSKNDLHPTMKPVEIPEIAITHSSKIGNIVADLFLGSGSTLIACEKTGRKCYGMEIDPHYCDVIVKRWEDYTGKQAILQTLNAG
jgi:DNA modification methylase